MLSFNFNGRDSYADFGILVASRPNIPAPKRRVEEFNILGKNGSEIVDLGTFDDIFFNVECGFKPQNRDALIAKFGDIKAWLFSAKKSKMYFSFDEGFCYYGQILEPYEMEILLRQAGKLNLTFRCEPFKYAKNPTTQTITSASGTVTVTGGWYAEPTYKLYGNSTDVSWIKVNNEQLFINQITDNLTIDSSRKIAFSEQNGEKFFKVDKTFGLFPFLNIGENLIEKSSAISKIEIEFTERWI